MRAGALARVALWSRARRRAAEPGWELRVPERVELAPATSGTLPIAIAVDRGLHDLARTRGVILDLAPDGVHACKKRRLGRADAVDPDADAPRFAVPVRAEAAGDFAVKLHAAVLAVRQQGRAARSMRGADAMAVAGRHRRHIDVLGS